MEVLFIYRRWQVIGSQGSHSNWLPKVPYTSFLDTMILCLLYARVGWSVLSTHRLMHWHILIYKTILGLHFTTYRCTSFKKVWKIIVFAPTVYSYYLPILNWELFRNWVYRKMTWISESWSHWFHFFMIWRQTHLSAGVLTDPFSPCLIPDVGTCDTHFNFDILRFYSSFFI